MVCALFLLLLICCNPLSPTEYEVANGVTMTPQKVTLPIGGVQIFNVSSQQGRLDDIRVRLLGAQVYDGECACERYVELGNLKKIDSKTYRYTAPTEVRESIELPLTFKIYVAYGEVGHGAHYEDLAFITVTR